MGTVNESYAAVQAWSCWHKERGLSGGRRPLARVPAGWFPLLQWFLQGEKSGGIWVCTLVRGQLKGFPVSSAILPTCGGSACAHVSPHLTRPRAPLADQREGPGGDEDCAAEADGGADRGAGPHVLHMQGGLQVPGALPDPLGAHGRGPAILFRGGRQADLDSPQQQLPLTESRPVPGLVFRAVMSAGSFYLQMCNEKLSSVDEETVPVAKAEF